MVQRDVIHFLGRWINYGLIIQFNSEYQYHQGATGVMDWWCLLESLTRVTWVKEIFGPPLYKETWLLWEFTNAMVNAKDYRNSNLKS